MDIGEVLSRAWQIIWKHKVLWIFGILTGCASGGGGGGNVSSSFQGRDNLSPPVQRYFNQIERFFNQIPTEQLILYVAIAVAIFLVLIVVAIFLGTIGRIGLVRGAMQADQGAEKLTFGELFSGSMPFFWRIFLLNLVVGLVFGLVGAAIFLAVTVGAVLTLGIGLVCLIPLLCVLIPIAWLVSIVLEQANLAIIVEDLGIMDGLRRGWQVLTTNLGTILIMWLILGLGVGLVGGLIIASPMLLIGGPALFGLLARTEQAMQTGLLAAGICLVVYLPVMIVLSGILTSFTETSWTLTFLRITGRKAASQESLPEPAA